MELSLSPFVRESFVSRVRFGSPVTRQPARSPHPGLIWCLLTGLHSPSPLRFPLEPPCAIGLVPSLSGHAIALPMAFTTETRHRASSSQGSSINGRASYSVNVRPSFPTSTTGTVGPYFKGGLMGYLLLYRFIDLWRGRGHPGPPPSMTESATAFCFSRWFIIRLGPDRLIM